jgi:cytokinin riboside 5'-monophosphate phosphoribohydrolase
MKYVIRSVTVYCSSSAAVAREYFEAAQAAGRAIASNGWRLVYGGNLVGLMKTLAESCREAGGKVVGITPQLMVDKGIHDPLADELLITQGMRERKAIMEERGDAFLTLPGGLGTFEEIFEIIVAKQLKYHRKPIVLLNTSGYFDPLLAMLDHGIERQFIKPKARQLFFVADDVDEAVEYLRSYTAVELADKWFEDGAARPPSGIE